MATAVFSGSAAAIDDLCRLAERTGVTVTMRGDAIPERFHCIGIWPRSPDATQLTMREQDVLVALIECPESSMAMARHLGLSINTVNRYLTSLYQKTGARNRVQLMRWALREALKVNRS